MRPQRGRARNCAAAFVLALGISLAPAIADGTVASAAVSITYPSWADVQAARASEAATQAQVAAITALLAQLQTNLDTARTVEQQKGQAYAVAQDAYDQQVVKAHDLRAQADTARAHAAEAKDQASRLIAALGRAGAGDIVGSLIADSGEADSLLYRLSAMSRLSTRSEQVYADALQLRNTAQSLTDQAAIAEQKLDELQVAAQAALVEAQKAATAAAQALQEQQLHQAELQAQLAVLTQKRQATEADYQAGVAAREAARKEAARIEAARRAAAAAAAAAAGSPEISGAWARPSGGYISSNFGNRFSPIYHRWKLHSGVDLAGVGCGAPIRAAHAGTVTYAGRNGDLGNFIQINHGDGTASGYGHILAGGILVDYGEYVSAGQQIARVGSTGGSTGCHLHFIIRVNGQLTDPVPFMRDRGIVLG